MPFRQLLTLPLTGSFDAEITGVPALGETLTASAPDAVNPTFQWKRDGVDIPGATGSTYVVTEDDGGTELTVTVTGDLVETTAAVQIGLPTIRVDEVVEPWVTAHRGFGELYAPDNAPSSVVAALTEMDDHSQMFMDCDTQLTSDGVFVVHHDTTVDRTTDGTGTVASKTLAQFKALTINPSAWADPMPGWPDEAPMTLEEFVDLVARDNRQAFLCEAKNSGELTTLLTLLDDVKEYALVETHTLSQVATIKAAGFRCMYLPLSSGEVAATIAAADPDYVAIGITWYDNTWRQTLADAGVKVVSATSARRSVFASEIAKPGTIGMASADPVYTLGRNEVRNTDDFATGKYGHGLIPSENNTSVPAGDASTGFRRPSFTGTPKRLYFDDPTTVKSQWCLIGNMGRPEPFQAIEWTFTYDVNAVMTLWPAIAAWCPDDRDFYAGQNTATNKGQGILALLRANGSMELFRSDTPAVAQVSLATAVPSVSIAAGASVPCRLERLTGVDAEKIKFTRLDTGHSITSTVAQGVGGPGGWTRGGYIHFGKCVEPAGTTRRSVSNVVITP